MPTPIQVSTENLADEGKPVSNHTRVTVGKLAAQTEFQFRDALVENKWNSIPAQASVRSDTQNLKSFLFDQDMERIGATQDYNGDRFKITDRAEVAKLAHNLGIPASDIASARYSGNDKVSEIAIAYSDGLSPETIAIHNASLALAVEQKDLMAPGTTFALAQRGLVDAGAMLVEHNVDDSVRRLIMSPAQNETGQELRLATGRSGTHISVGRSELTGDGKVFMRVSPQEFKAAERLAETLGVTVSGEAGLTPFGVALNVNQSLTRVLDRLGAAGFIDPTSADNLTRHVDAQPARPMGPSASQALSHTIA